MLEYLLVIASGLVSTVYGLGEQNCGDIGEPVACTHGAITASGVPFNPDIPQIAIAAPSEYRLRPTTIRIRIEGGKCHKVQLVDKMNPRYVGQRGFDLTPAAVRLLTGQPATLFWSAPVYVCDIPSWKDAVMGLTKLNTSVMLTSIP